MNFVDIQGNKLILSTEKTVEIESISIDVTNINRTSIILYIQSLYRYGYSEIEVKFNKPVCIHHRTGKEVTISSVVHKIVNRLIGAEVIEQSENRILIKYVTKETQEDFKIVLRRALLLLKEASQGLLDGISKNDMNQIATIEEKHDTINKFVNYCLRLLNKYGYPDVKKTSFYYHIIASVDKITDILKYNAREILEYKKKFDNDTVEVWAQLNKSIDMYYDLFYKFSFDTVNKLSENRDYVKNLLKKNTKKLPREELVLLTSQKQILEILLDLTEFVMGLEY